MSDSKRKDRPGDQPLPVPNDGPSMHDLVCEDLESGRAIWLVRDAISADLQARKQLGLDRYGSLLQDGNGRDALRDLYEELLDASVYAKQVQAEHGAAGIAPVYEMLLNLLYRVKMMAQEAER